MNTAWQLLAAEGWLLRVKLAKCCTALCKRPMAVFCGLTSQCADQALRDAEGE